MNHRAVKSLKTVALATLAVATQIGCDDRAARIATEAADRQAEQNREFASLNREVAAGTARLVAEDAKARGQALKVHEDLQNERASLAQGWGDLEAERRRLAQSRRTDSALVAIVSGGAATMAALLALALAWLAFYRSTVEEQASPAVFAQVIDAVFDGPLEPVRLPSQSPPAQGNLLPAADPNGLDAETP